MDKIPTTEERAKARLDRIEFGQLQEEYALWISLYSKTIKSGGESSDEIRGASFRLHGPSLSSRQLIARAKRRIEGRPPIAAESLAREVEAELSQDKFSRFMGESE